MNVFEGKRLVLIVEGFGFLAVDIIHEYLFHQRIKSSTQCPPELWSSLSRIIDTDSLRWMADRRSRPRKRHH